MKISRLIRPACSLEGVHFPENLMACCSQRAFCSRHRCVPVSLRGGFLDAATSSVFPKWEPKSCLVVAASRTHSTRAGEVRALHSYLLSVLLPCYANGRTHFSPMKHPP